MLVNHEFFDGSAESDYVAGLLAADGWVDSNARYWCLQQSGDHGKLLVEAVKELIDTDTHVKTLKTLGKDGHKIHITSSKMCEDLDIIYDVRARKTYNYRGPYNTARMSKAFIRGYLDGDGSIGRYAVGDSKDLLVVSFVGTPSFIDRVRLEVPIPPSVRTIPHAKSLVELRWNGAKAFDFCNWLYSDHHLPISSKYLKFSAYTDDAYHYPPNWLKHRPTNDEVIRLWKSGYSRAECGRLTSAGHSAYKIISRHIESDNDAQIKGYS